MMMSPPTPHFSHCHPPLPCPCPAQAIFQCTLTTLFSSIPFFVDGRDDGEDARPGRSVWGVVFSSFMAANCRTKNDKNIFQCSLRWPPFNIIHATTNQKQAGTTERGWYRMCSWVGTLDGRDDGEEGSPRQSVWGGCYFFSWGSKLNNNKTTNIIYDVALHRWSLFNSLHATTNQKHSGVMEGGGRIGCTTRRGHQGSVIPLFWACLVHQNVTHQK